MASYFSVNDEILNLEDLLNVEITTKKDKYVLQYSSKLKKYILAMPEVQKSKSKLSELEDVNTTEAKDGFILYYNEADEMFKFKEMSGGGSSGSGGTDNIYSEVVNKGYVGNKDEFYEELASIGLIGELLDKINRRHKCFMSITLTCSDSTSIFFILDFINDGILLKRLFYDNEKIALSGYANESYTFSVNNIKLFSMENINLSIDLQGEPVNIPLTLDNKYIIPPNLVVTNGDTNSNNDYVMNFVKT